MRLELRVGLKQTLAPVLIQSLKMLQMPVLRLEQFLRHELATNPLLEEQEPVEKPEREDEVVDREKSDVGEEKIDWEAYLGETSEFVPHRFTEKPAEEWEHTPVAETTLYEHLTEQLKLSKCPPELVEIGEFIIGNLDESGYLHVSLAELAEMLKVETSRVEAALAIVQGFDPAGVGARNLRESLQIQLRIKEMEGSLVYRLVTDHLDDLDKKTHQQLAKAMGTNPERIREALEFLKKLSPKPAHGQFADSARIVIPDLIIDRIDNEYVVYHNDRTVPSLRFSATYKQLLRRGNNVPAETKKYVREKLDQARWLINAINQRRSTMIKVMEAIVEEQRAFFDKGPAHLKPLIMEDIARRVEMNVATISRVSKGKYVQTPQGVYEIKRFFNAGVARSDGGSMTKSSVKDRIREIIAAENPQKPHSDQEIFRRLQTEGITLARRTVTKYREELNLPSARFRKRTDTAAAPAPVVEHVPESREVQRPAEDEDPFALPRSPGKVTKARELSDQKITDEGEAPRSEDDPDRPGYLKPGSPTRPEPVIPRLSPGGDFDL